MALTSARPDLTLTLADWNMSGWYTAETAVIGSLLIDQRCAGVVFSRAKPEYFHRDLLRRMFEACFSLWSERLPIDPITMIARAGIPGEEETVAEIMRVTPTAANVEEYLAILEDSARYDEIRRAAAEVLECMNTEEAEAAYEALGRKLTRAGRVESVSWVDCILEYLDRMHDESPPDFLTWGLPEINAKLHVEAGDYVIIGAEPSAGKTALALQFAYSQAEAGKAVGFFSLETNRKRLVNRLMAEQQVAGIELLRSRMHNLSPKDYERAGDAGIRANRIPLRIINNAYRIEDIRREVILSGLQVIYIDYLQLIRWPASSRHEAVTNISLELHRMAQELGVTVVALSQVTNPEKGKGHKAATKNDLRESDQLLQDAEIIMMLNVTSPNTRLLTVEKNKDEGKAVIDLKFDARHMSFGYLPPPKSNAGKPQPGQVDFHELSDDDEEVPF